MSKSCLHDVWPFSLKLLLCALFFTASSAIAQCESWEFESIVPGSKPAGVISSDRLPRACYSSVSQLKYCYGDHAGWHHESVEGTYGGSAATRSTQIDSLDRFHVVYCGYDLYLILPWIKYKYRDGEGWHGGGVAYYVWYSGLPTLALDTDMSPHIAYTAQGVLTYWHLGASGAESEIVSTASSPWSSISVSGNGQPCIMYVDEEESELRYAWKGLIGWQYQVIAGNGSTAQGHRLVHDASGEPRACYYDGKSQSLWYAKRVSGDWFCETVDSSGDVGQYCSLVLDSSGWPHISYYDATNGDLKYAFKDGNDWQITRVDTVGDVGKSTTIQLDEYGNAYFFYHDMTNNMIKWAYPALSASTSLEGGTLALHWSTVGGAEEYWIYGAENDPWFEADLEWPFEKRLFVLDSGVTQYSTTTGIGNPESNWSYLIIAVDDQYHELARSNRVGEWDWGMNLEYRISGREYSVE